jgi:hypothetical protein
VRLSAQQLAHCTFALLQAQWIAAKDANWLPGYEISADRFFEVAASKEATAEAWLSDEGHPGADTRGIFIEIGGAIQELTCRYKNSKKSAPTSHHW